MSCNSKGLRSYFLKEMFYMLYMNVQYCTGAVEQNKTFALIFMIFFKMVDVQALSTALSAAL